MDKSNSFTDIFKSANLALNHLQNQSMSESTDSKNLRITAESSQQITDIQKNISKSSKRTADEITKLNEELSSLRIDLDEERARAEEAEKRNKRFSFFISILVTFIGFGLSVLFNWLNR